ncbi:MAG: DUF5908 family protein [Candidatus Electrothrix scaldis]|nr:MAG: DUF5908 family protein [Candidatus Electrothrix sp. GW3-3]
MGIDIKKLVIKTVIEPQSAPQQQPQQYQDLEYLKAQLLSQCRQMIQDTLRREKER